MTGEQRIGAGREDVWRALNDPEILRQCIPGCEEMDKISDTEFSAKVTAKVGPVKAKFTGVVTLSDLDPPAGYTISGEGKGGAAGFAKGGAKVRLEEDGADTVLTYEVKATVGGKMAQLGSRLIDGTARKMANDFFGKFAELVGRPAPEAAEPAVPAEPTQPAEPAVTAAPAAPAEAAEPAVPAEPAKAARGGLSPTTWIVGLIVIVLIVLAIFAAT